MHGERISPNEICQPLERTRVFEFRHFRAADIAYERNTGSHLTDNAVRSMELRTLDGLPLAADTHREAPLGTDRREISIDAERILISTGHTGDHERKRQLFAEKMRSGINFGKIEFRQRIMEEFPPLKPGGLLPKYNIPADRQLDMLLLA
jgi:hypothetical protein